MESLFRFGERIRRGNKMEKSNHKKLIEEILRFSNSPIWEYAKMEWELDYIFQRENNCIWCSSGTYYEANY